MNRYHLEDPIVINTVSGPVSVGKGWLLITEEEYAELTEASVEPEPEPRMSKVRRSIFFGGTILVFGLAWAAGEYPKFIIAWMIASLLTVLSMGFFLETIERMERHAFSFAQAIKSYFP